MSGQTTQLDRLRQELIGSRYGRLVVRSIGGKNNHGQTLWLCRCDCSGTTLTYSTSLKRGRTRSCGCITRKQGGRWNTPEYRSWRNMLYRCYNRTCNRFRVYGARGIKVCARWRKSLEAFVADMGRCPPGHSLDRIDNDDDYKPSNCRWATSQQQARNTSRNVILTHAGKSLPIVDWAALTGLPFRLIHQRVRAGWSAADTLTRPPKRYTPR